MFKLLSPYTWIHIQILDSDGEATSGGLGADITYRFTEIGSCLHSNYNMHRILMTHSARLLPRHPFKNKVGAAGMEFVDHARTNTQVRVHPRPHTLCTKPDLMLRPAQPW